MSASDDVERGGSDPDSDGECGPGIDVAERDAAVAEPPLPAAHSGNPLALIAGLQSKHAEAKASAKEARSTPEEVEAKKLIDESGLKVQSAILLSEAADLVKQAVA